MTKWKFKLKDHFITPRKIFAQFNRREILCGKLQLKESREIAMPENFLCLNAILSHFPQGWHQCS